MAKPNSPSYGGASVRSVTAAARQPPPEVVADELTRQPPPEAVADERQSCVFYYNPTRDASVGEGLSFVRFLLRFVAVLAAWARRRSAWAPARPLFCTHR